MRSFILDQFFFSLFLFLFRSFSVSNSYFYISIWSVYVVICLLELLAISFGRFFQKAQYNLWYIVSAGLHPMKIHIFLLHRRRKKRKKKTDKREPFSFSISFGFTQRPNFKFMIFQNIVEMLLSHIR